MSTEGKMFVLQKRPSYKTVNGQLRNVVLLAQCFGLMPIDGILYGTHERLRFRWRSFKTVYSIVAIIGAFFMMSMSVFHIYKEGYSLPRIGEIFFYSNAVVTVLAFMKLATEWPKLIKTWSNVEKEIEKHYGCPAEIERKLVLIITAVMLLATVEHLLSIGFQVVRLMKGYYEIKHGNNNNNSLTGALFFQVVHSQVFNYLNYSVYLAIVVEVICISSTFIWTYSNIFIIALSVALAERFKQITKRLLIFQKIQSQFQGIKWNEMREDYTRLSRLCIFLDSTLSYVVLICFTYNLLFILLQLCYSFKIPPIPIFRIYFIFSFTFLIFRTVMVCIFAAEIFDESKRPAEVLRTVPSSLYNIEVHRFLFQVKFYNVALTGCRLFRITRGLILQIAGAVVSYELILIQFDVFKTP